MKTKLWFLGLIFSAFLSQAQIINIPDPVFKNIILTYSPKIDLNNNGEIEVTEAEQVFVLKIYSNGIANFLGLNYFKKLTNLEINGNNQLIANMDLTTMTLLKSLSLIGVTAFLNITKNTALTSLKITGQGIRALDLTNNSNLKILNLSRNQLTSLDITNLLGLTDLNLSDNQITALNTINLQALNFLDVSKNQIKSINVTGNPALLNLKCRDNLLTSIDLSNNSNLEHIELNQNQLTNLDISNLSKLKMLFCARNKLSTLNTTANLALTQLGLGYNLLSILDLSKNINLTNLDIESNNLTSINLSQNNKLELLATPNNLLTNIDLSSNVNLTTFYCSGGNNLLSLDLTKNSKLVSVQAGCPNLTQICVTALQNTTYWLKNAYASWSTTCRPTTIWDGAAWSAGIPNSGSIAIIKANYLTTANGNITCYDLSIGVGATLNVPVGGNVTVANNYVINGTSIKCGTIAVTGTTYGQNTTYQKITSAITGPISVCPYQTNAAFNVTSNPAATYTWTIPSAANIVGNATGNSISVNFNGTTIGSQTVSVIEKNGCGTNNQQVNLAVTVLPAPSVSISAQNPTCGNPPTTLTATGGATYVWSTTSYNVGLSSTTGNPIVATPTSNFGYNVSVKGTGSNGCTASATTSITPGVIGTPVIQNIIPGNSTTKLYGMTIGDGQYNKGTIFEWNLQTNVFTKKQDFNDGFSADDADEELRYYNGKFYGIKSWGGSNNMGILFEWNPTTNIMTKKIDFNGLVNGSYPDGSLLLVNGKFYGMTSAGGNNNLGTLFEWDPSNNVLTKKIDFNGVGNGASPISSLRMQNNICYGTTQGGGSFGAGVLFKYNISTNFLTKSIDFDGISKGSMPNNAPVYLNGKFYGTTRIGGSNDVGVLYEWDPVSNSVIKKVDFSGSAGYYGGVTGLSILTVFNGKLYGVTSSGGTNNSGSIFEYNPSGSLLTTKYNFDGIPTGGLSLVGGKFYGLCKNSIFEWNPTTNVFIKKQFITGAGSLVESLSDSYICYDLIPRNYSATITGSAVSWNWTMPAGANINSGGGTSSISVVYSAAAASGNITLTASNACGISNSVSYPITVNDCNASSGPNPRMDMSSESIIQGSNLIVGFNIYPNPSNGVFNISLENSAPATIVVTNLIGKEVLRTNVQNNTTPINLQDNAKGIYHVKIEGTKFSKVINLQ
ncbi:MAG: T9SS type A sorting domain-containing protein [Opitutaceae bacterium]|nr:T9SS type A sorting domain-containing protein [Cytophagales bacterium]